MLLQAAAIAVALALAWGGLQTWRLDRCQGEVAAAQQTIGALGADLKAQNAAVAKLAAEGAAKAATAAVALRKAEDRARVWDQQARKLRDALTNRKPTDSTDCKSAWNEIRQSSK